MWLVNFFFSVFLTVIVSVAVMWVTRQFGYEIVSPWDYLLGAGVFLLLFLPGRNSKKYQNPGNNDLFPGM